MIQSKKLFLDLYRDIQGSISEVENLRPNQNLKLMDRVRKFFGRPYPELNERKFELFHRRVSEIADSHFQNLLDQYPERWIEASSSKIYRSDRDNKFKGLGALATFVRPVRRNYNQLGVTLYYTIQKPLFDAFLTDRVSKNSMANEIANHLTHEFIHYIQVRNHVQAGRNKGLKKYEIAQQMYGSNVNHSSLAENTNKSSYYFNHLEYDAYSMNTARTLLFRFFQDKYSPLVSAKSVLRNLGKDYKNNVHYCQLLSHYRDLLGSNPEYDREYKRYLKKTYLRLMEYGTDYGKVKYENLDFVVKTRNIHDRINSRVENGTN